MIDLQLLKPRRNRQWANRARSHQRSATPNHQWASSPEATRGQATPEATSGQARTGKTKDYYCSADPLTDAYVEAWSAEWRICFPYPGSYRSSSEGGRADRNTMDNYAMAGS